MISLGMIETNSIPKGIEAADAMMKAADVNLVLAQTACAGKFVVMVSAGNVASVKSSVEAGNMTAADTLVDHTVIPNISDDIPKAMNACMDLQEAEALGIVETFSLTAAILGADIACKTAGITLMEIRLGRGLGGKAFFTLVGDVASVEAACGAVKASEDIRGLLARTVVIPAVHKDVLHAIL